MQRASKRAPQWLRDLGVFILVMGGAVGICMLLSACYDDNNPFATSVFILAVVLVSRFTNGYLPGVLAAAFGVRVDDLLTCRAAEKEEHLKPDITPVPSKVIR